MEERPVVALPVEEPVQEWGNPGRLGVLVRVPDPRGFRAEPCHQLAGVPPPAENRRHAPGRAHDGASTDRNFGHAAPGRECPVSGLRDEFFPYFEHFVSLSKLTLAQIFADVKHKSVDISLDVTLIGVYSADMDDMKNPLRQARLLAGILSATDAAGRLGIHRETLYGYERGQAVASGDVLGRMAALYGVTVDQLLGRVALR